MAYFGGSQNLRGDPGFFDSLFGGIKKVARKALPFAGPVGFVASQFFKPATPPGRPRQITQVVDVRRRTRQANIPFGKTGFEGLVEGRPRRRRMNVGNAKALRRAIRRTDGFVRLARGALKNTGFKIVSKSSGKVSRATMDKAVAAAHHAK